MGIKKVIRFFVGSVGGLVLLASCAHHSKKTAGPEVVFDKNQHLLQGAQNEATPNAETQTTATTELPQNPESVGSADPRKPVFAVWIDSYGVDALAALGTLQELDKGGFKPSKIMGTGLGCWIAQSWSFANHPNQAEWQALKWNDWKSLGGSFFGRLTGSRSAHFEDNVLKLATFKNWEQLSIPTDCPVLPLAPPFHLRSARDLKPETAFWISLQLEVFGLSESQLSASEFFAGSLAGAPNADELAEFTQDLKLTSEQRFVGWLVLSTRGIFVEESNATKPVRVLLTGRDLNWPHEVKSLVEGEAPYRVLKMDLTHGAKRHAADLILPENRRRFLLEGRKMGLQVLQDPDFQTFIGGR